MKTRSQGGYLQSTGGDSCTKTGQTGGDTYTSPRGDIPTYSYISDRCSR